MAKLKKQVILAPEKHVLAIPDHYVALTGQIAFANLNELATSSNFYPTKQVMAGTLIHMKADGEVVKPTDDLVPNGIIFNTIDPADFDSTDTKVNTTILVHGFVRADRLVELTTGDKEKLANEMIYQLAK